MVFNNTQEAEKAVMKENLWSLHYTNTTVEGKKKFYRCNKAKNRRKQCAASIYLLFESISDQFVLYRDESDHTQDAIQEKSLRISNEVKELWTNG
jgi:hypothetical protein